MKSCSMTSIFKIVAFMCLLFLFNATNIRQNIKCAGKYPLLKSYFDKKICCKYNPPSECDADEFKLNINKNLYFCCPKSSK